MNEVSLPPHEPIRSLVVGVLATVGGACAAAANHIPADCGLLYWIFQLFFIHKKEREGKLEKKKETSIHKKTCPGTKSPDMFVFFSARTNSKNFTLFTSLHVSTSSSYEKQ